MAAPCSCLVTAVGQVLCCRLKLSSCAGHLCRCTCLEMRGQNGPRAISKITKWVPNCTVLLIVLRFFLCVGETPSVTDTSVAWKFIEGQQPYV